VWMSRHYTPLETKMRPTVSNILVFTLFTYAHRLMHLCMCMSVCIYLCMYLCACSAANKCVSMARIWWILNLSYVDSHHHSDEWWLFPCCANVLELTDSNQDMQHRNLLDAWILTIYAHCILIGIQKNSSKVASMVTV
jgi:hypothetical protein